MAESAAQRSVFSFHYKGTLGSVREVLECPSTRQSTAPSGLRSGKGGTSQLVISKLCLHPLKSSPNPLPPCLPQGQHTPSWEWSPMPPSVPVGFLHCFPCNGQVLKWRNFLRFRCLRETGKNQGEKNDYTVKAAERTSKGNSDHWGVLLWTEMPLIVPLSFSPFVILLQEWISRKKVMDTFYQHLPQKSGMAQIQGGKNLYLHNYIYLRKGKEKGRGREAKGGEGKGRREGREI